MVNYELSRAFNDVHRFPAHQAGAGDIVALAGVDCESGVTFTDGKAKVTLGNSELKQWHGWCEVGLSENVGYIPNEIAIKNRDNDH